MKATLIKKRLNSWLIMLTCGIFYSYQFALRVLPNTLSEEFMSAFHVEAAGLGIIIALYSASYAGLQIPLGITIDRIKIRYLLPIAPLLCALGTLGMVYSDNLTQAAASRFLIGAGSAFGFIGSVKVATIILPSNRISAGVGMIIFFGTIGAILGGKPLKALTNYYDWRTVILCTSLIGIIISLILFIALSSILVTLKQAQIASKRSILKDIRSIFSKPQIGILSIYGMLTYLPITILGAGWGIGFITVHFNVGYNIAATAIACMFVGAGLGSPIIAVVSEMVKSRKVIMLFSSIVASFLYILLIYVDLRWSHYTLCACLFLAGVLYSAKTLSFALACDLGSKQSSGLTTSILNMSIMGAGLIFHPLIGFLLNKGKFLSTEYTKYDYKVALSVLPISAFCAFLLVLFIRDARITQSDNPENQLLAVDE